RQCQFTDPHRSAHADLRLRALWRPNTGLLEAIHRLIREFGARTVTANHKHQDRFNVGVALRHILKTADHTRGERHHIKRPKIDKFHFALFVFPARAPGPGHRDEGLIGVVIVHFRTVAGPGFAVSEIEAFAYLDCRKLRRLLSDWRRHRTARTFRRLKADDVEQCAL